MRKRISLGAVVDRALQVFGIGLLSLICYGIALKGVNIILDVIQNSPGDFWGGLLEEILRNVGSSQTSIPH